MRNDGSNSWVGLNCGHSAGAKRLIPQQWRKYKEFDDIHKLDGVAVITVQLRYNGWITELQDANKQNDVSQVRPAASKQSNTAI